MKRPLNIFVLASVIASSMNAQITLVGPSLANGFTTLEDAGLKLFEDTGDSIVIFNDDLTVYQQWQLPPPPAGYNRAGIGYITEDLFDTDPTTIEYYVPYYTTGPVYGMRILRTDGTLLFEDLTHVLWTNAGGYAYQKKMPIFNTGSGTFMSVRTWDDQSGSLYALPGHLPCSDCSDLSTGLDIVGTDASSGGINLFPLPADASIVVQLTDAHERIKSATVIDASGKLVAQYDPVVPSSSLTMATGSLPAGSYVITVSISNGVQHSARFNIVH